MSPPAYLKLPRTIASQGRERLGLAVSGLGILQLPRYNLVSNRWGMLLVTSGTSPALLVGGMT
jgi:hypothetical protein